MHRVDVDELFEGRQSKYALVVGVSKRAREITQELIDEKVVTEEKPVLLAIDEIRDHKFNVLEPENDD